MKEAWRKGLLVAGVACAAGAGYLASKAVHQGGHDRGPAVKAATVLNDTRPLPPFSLKGPSGEFTNDNLKGKWTFVFFGYTHCPDVCPTALSLLRDVRGKVAAAGGTLPEVVFVSVDAARDTPELLGRYVPAFDPSFKGVTGSDEALAPLVKMLGVFYERHEKEDPRNYLVDHSAAMYLIDPQGRLKALFMPPIPAERMAEDYQALTGAGVR